MNITHRPKGTMCIYCKNFQGDIAIHECPTHEQLKLMRQIGKDKDGVIVVKCEKFDKLTGFTLSK